MRKVFIILSCIIFIFVTGILFLANKMVNDVDSILNKTIEEINLETVDDGIYVGEYNEALMVKATVEVTVLNHEIKKIRIVSHDNGKGAAAEVITTSFISEQSVLVDDIVGATISSRVLKLAVIDALKEE